MQKENKTIGSTSTLFKKLFVEPDIEKILESNSDDFEVLPFHEYLSNITTEKGSSPNRSSRIPELNEPMDIRSIMAQEIRPE